MKRINQILDKKNGDFREKVLQFGEGNFLRAFTDWMIDKANSEGVFDGSIVVVQPIERGLAQLMNAQDNMYTLAMRGLENGKKMERIEMISSISRAINPYENYEDYIALAKSDDLEVVISNTTEAGITYVEGMKLDDKPQKSFPSKLCAFLYERYNHFNGEKDKGLLFLPVELIDNNGSELREIIIKHAKEWNLGDDFINWIENSNTFANTLVDRIVTGYPKEEIEEYQEKLNYIDDILVTSELFNLWVIEADQKYSEVLPIHKTEENVIWTNDVKPYKKRKVRILNGAHTSSVLAAYLSGHNYVLDMMNDEIFEGYLRNLTLNEVIPGISLPKDELIKFAEDVFERFNNPFIKHKLLDISLNSVSKFTARCLPSLKDYKKDNGTLPKYLSFSLAALIKFYDIKKIDDNYYGIRENGDIYEVRDDKVVLEFMTKVWSRKNEIDVVLEVLSNDSIWSGQNLNNIEGLHEEVKNNLDNIIEHGIVEAISKINR